MTLSLIKCRFLAASGGTSDFVVGSAVAGYSLPADAGAEDGLVYKYVAFVAGEFEIGSGAWSSTGSAVDRGEITSSSNGDALVNFSAAPTVVMTEASLERATQAEAVAGTANDKIMTPLRTAQAIPGSGFLSIDVKTTTGAQTVTIPANATKCKVRMVAAGGGAGAAGTQGGGGGYLEKWLTGLTPGNTFNLTVGAGVNSDTGGKTELTSGTQSISTLTCNGGQKGDIAGAPGGTATGGDVNVQGGRGGDDQSGTSRGYGGTTPLGGSTVGSSSGPVAGQPYGGGAGGGSTSGSVAGGQGIAIFEWYA